MAALRILGVGAIGDGVLGRTPGPGPPAGHWADGAAFEPAGWPWALALSPATCELAVDTWG